MAFRIFITVLLAVASVQWVSAQGGSIRLPDVVGATRGMVRSVEISANDTQVLNKARGLFALHGGIDERRSGRTDFGFRFELLDGSGIRLTISSGGQQLLQESFRGADLNQAVARAADFAVRRTLGIPGFFDSRIAFISDRTGSTEVYLSNMLFTNLRQLTNDRAKALLPNLSPDGTRLLYTSYYRNGFPDIYQIDLNSGRRTVFASYRGTNTGATFSPDGRQVAMILSGTGNPELYISDDSGRRLRQLTHTSGLEADPSWSPDGQRIVLTSDQAGRPQIFTVDVTGRNLQRVPTNISRNCSEPTWNQVHPEWIAFTAAMAGSFQVCVYSFNERESRVVTRSPGDAVHPFWLNDGRHLVYTERTSRYNRLMILDVETGSAAPLSPREFGNAQQAHVVPAGR